jgi:flagellar basal body-associated protein FliL
MNEEPKSKRDKAAIIFFIIAMVALAVALSVWFVLYMLHKLAQGLN